MIKQYLRQLNMKVEGDSIGFAILTPAESCNKMDELTVGEKDG